MKGFIYKFENKVNGKVYIGQTRQKIKTRYRQHINAAKKNKGNLLQRALNKYGENNFNFEIIEEIECEAKKELIDILNDLEIKYIKEYDCLTPKGYNILKGGRVGEYVFNYEKEAKFLNISYLLQESIFDNGTIYLNLPEYCEKTHKSLNDAYYDLMFSFTLNFHWVNASNIKFVGQVYPPDSTIQDILDKKAIPYVCLTI